jgi:hypothetical protein
MWKPGHRVAADRRGLRCESDLTDAEWALVAPLIRPAGGCGGHSARRATSWRPAFDWPRSPPSHLRPFAPPNSSFDPDLRLLQRPRVAALTGARLEFQCLCS